MDDGPVRRQAHDPGEEIVPGWLRPGTHSLASVPRRESVYHTPGAPRTMADMPRGVAHPTDKPTAELGIALGQNLIE